MSIGPLELLIIAAVVLCPGVLAISLLVVLVVFLKNKNSSNKQLSVNNDTSDKQQSEKKE